MSELKVNKISPETGTAITLGDSGDTFTIPSGAIITNSGTANGFGGGGILQMICKQDGERASDSTVTGITNDDDYLEQLEREAYETGNIMFRSWTDSLTGNKLEESIKQLITEKNKNKDPFGLNAYALQLAKGMEEQVSDYKVYLDILLQQ